MDWEIPSSPPTGVSQHALPSMEVMKVFSNPFTSVIKLTAYRPLKDADITLTAIDGTRVYSKRMDISGDEHIYPGILAPGMYMLTVKTNNRIVVTQRIMHL